MKGPSLLQKLLHKEIRREQSLLFQCFRYIIDEQFFDGDNLTNEVKERLEMIQSRTNDEMTYWNNRHPSKSMTTTETTASNKEEKKETDEMDDIMGSDSSSSDESEREKVDNEEIGRASCRERVL